MLDAICAAKDLSYFVEPFGVVFLPRSAGTQLSPQVVRTNMSLRARLETQKMEGMKFVERPLSEIVEQIRDTPDKENPNMPKPNITIEIPEDELPFYAVSGSIEDCT